MGYQFIEGQELMMKFEEQVKQFPVEQKIGLGVTELLRNDGLFEVRMEDDVSYRAKAVIIATGKRPRQLNVPGEEKLKGRGVSYCAICDGPLFADENVAIIGGGNSALEAVDDMVKIATQVYLVSHTSLTGDKVLVDKLKEASNLTVLLEHDVVEIEGSKRVERITIKDLKSGGVKRMDVGGVFVEIGLLPNNELARGITRINDSGEIEVDCSCTTSIPGLFAAGDVTDAPEKQIVVAAGEGAKAALQAQRYLQRI
jgi:alkyl hydroperoxide reductase subunit F